MAADEGILGFQAQAVLSCVTAVVPARYYQVGAMIML